jgi:hypothetical protein
MDRTKQVLAAAAAAMMIAGAAESRAALPAAELTYVDLADLSLTAPVVAHVRLKRAVALKPAEAPNVRSGWTRFYIQAEVVSLLRGAEGLPTEVSYLADVRNVGPKPAKLARKSEYLVLAGAVPGRPAELRLVAPDAQLPFTPQRAETIRGILREAASANAAPRITGIGRAFHVPGALPGESETQFFLQTADGRPVSLSVLRRPGESPDWSVALSEITDDSAAAPAPNSLLWYRLACTLPRSIPEQSYADAPESGDSIKADYALVIERLGPCVRSRA